jgi:hypothetical protein
MSHQQTPFNLQTPTQKLAGERVRSKPLINYIVENGKYRDDMFVNVTICNVPENLLREFIRTVVNQSYPGGISEALQDLMRKETQKQKKLDKMLGQAF